MVKLLALYKKPLDLDSFMTRLQEAYLPLLQKIPGVGDIVINNIKADAFGGEPSYFLMTEAHFADRDSFRQAMASEESQEAGRELMTFAQGLVTLLVSETEST